MGAIRVIVVAGLMGLALAAYGLTLTVWWLMGVR